MVWSDVIIKNTESNVDFTSDESKYTYTPLDITAMVDNDKIQQEMVERKNSTFESVKRNE